MRWKHVVQMVAFFGLLFASFPARAETTLWRAVRDMRANYVFYDRLKADDLLSRGALRAAQVVPWLFVDVNASTVALRTGDGVKLGEVQATNMDELARALDRLQELITGANRPIPKEVRLDVEILRGVTSGMDKWSEVLVDEQLEGVNEDRAGSYSGIGLNVHPEGRGLTISGIYPEGPAEKAGLWVGDVILAIDGVPTLGMGPKDSTALLRGVAGSTVRLEVARNGSEFQVQIVRGLITKQTVTHEVLASGVVLLDINDFSDKTPLNFRNIMVNLHMDGKLDKGIILDLRGNPGGLLSSATYLADQFLKRGLILAADHRKQGEDGTETTYFRASKSGFDPPAPIVVLVDAHSASSSEILAGALRMNNRAILVGKTTFGKGTGWRLFDLAPHVELRLTVVENTLAGDVSIHQTGLAPDILVEEATMCDGIVSLHGERAQAERRATLVDTCSKQTTGDATEAHGDPEVALAEQILLASHGASTDDLLAAADSVLPRINVEEQSQFKDLVADLDWRTLPASSTENLAVEVQIPDRNPAGIDVPVSVTVTNHGDKSAGQVIVMLRQAPGSSTKLRFRPGDEGEGKPETAMDGTLLPIGVVEAGGRRQASTRLHLEEDHPNGAELWEVWVENAGQARRLSGQMVLDIVGKPSPCISVKGALVAGPDGRQAGLSVTNLGPEALHDVDVGFSFPNPEKLRLTALPSPLPELAAEAQSKVDIGLLVQEAFQGTSLPLSLTLRTREFGKRTLGPFALPLDGAPLEIRSTCIAWRNPGTGPVGSNVTARVSVTDDDIDSVVVFVNEKKVAWSGAGQGSVELDVPITLVEGSNALQALVTDANGIQTSRRAMILGLAP